MPGENGADLCNLCLQSLEVDQESYFNLLEAQAQAHTYVVPSILGTVPQFLVLNLYFDYALQPDDLQAQNVIRCELVDLVELVDLQRTTPPYNEVLYK